MAPICGTETKNHKEKSLTLTFVYARLRHIFSWMCSSKQKGSNLTCYPFCHSSLISSLSSIKVRRLRRRNKTLMVRHLWNARTKTHPCNYFTQKPGPFRQDLQSLTNLELHFSWSCLAKHYQRSRTAELVHHAVDQWGKYRMSSHCYGSLRQNNETWWNTGWFSWLAALVSLAPFTVVFESDVTWPWIRAPFI